MWRRWRVSGEEALAGREAALWLREKTLTVEHAGEPLSRYAVEFATGTDKPSALRHPVLFGTSLRLAQPRLFTLSERGECEGREAGRLRAQEATRPGDHGPPRCSRPCFPSTRPGAEPPSHGLRGPRPRGDLGERVSTALLATRVGADRKGDARRRRCLRGYLNPAERWHLSGPVVETFSGPSTRRGPACLPLCFMADDCCFLWFGTTCVVALSGGGVAPGSPAPHRTPRARPLATPARSPGAARTPR